MVENFTRWVEAFPLVNASATEVCECIYDVITRFGCFDSLLSDLGSNLTSAVNKELCKKMNIKQVFTCSYRPQTNNIPEQQNKHIWNYIRIYGKDQKTWPIHLKPLLYSMRSLASPKSGMLSPAELMYGQPIKLPVDNLIWQEESVPKNATQFIKLMKERSEILDQVVKQNREEAQQANKKYYDKGATEPKFEIGDSVLLLNKGRKVGVMTKALPIMIGPFIIVQKGSGNTYKLRHAVSDKPLVRSVNGDRLRLCQPPAEKVF